MPKSADDVTAPVYNIGAVARLTGIPATSLRAWERRYGFPAAARSEGGQRLFSASDVRRLRWVKARIDEGLQTGRAIEALELAEKSGRLTDPAVGLVSHTAANPEPSPIGRERQAPAATPSPLVALRARMSDHLMSHDLEGADQVLEDLLAATSVETIILEVIRPILVDVGERWLDGSLSVATEHLVSSYLRSRLHAWQQSAPPAREIAPVVLACAPGEWHDLGLLMSAVLLRRRRWPVVFLGQAVPFEELDAFMAEVDAHLAVVSATRGETARELVAAIGRNGAPSSWTLCVAGRAFDEDPTLVDKLQGIYLGPSLMDGIASLEDRLNPVISGA